MTTKQKVKKSTQPPSKKRYDKRIPIFSIRMPLDWHQTLNEYLGKTGLTKRQFMASALGKLKLNFDTIYNTAKNEGYKKGYEVGKNDGKKLMDIPSVKIGKEIGLAEGTMTYGIVLPCPVCHTYYYLEPNSRQHQRIMDMMPMMCPKCLG